MAKTPPATALTNPKAVPIVLNTIYTPPLRGIRVGVSSGNVAVKNIDGDTVVFTNVTLGEILKGQIQQVLTSGTTVDSPTTNLVGQQ